MKLQSQPLSAEKQALLEKLIADPGFDILLEVLESGKFELQVEAANLRENGVDTLGAQKAAQLDSHALVIGHMIAKLETIRKKEEPLTTSTATP